MNIELIIGTIIIILILYYIFFNNIEQKEHFNEGTFYQLDPYVVNNLNTGLYPKCEKDVRSDNKGNKYCNDLPSFKKYTSPLYKSQEWVQTKYPSYFYPPWSISDKPHYIFSNDWNHRFR